MLITVAKERGMGQAAPLWESEALLGRSSSHSGSAELQMPTRSNQDLARASKAGDRGAFGELIDIYQKPVYNLALRMTGTPEDAMDVTQSAFLKAYQNLSRFDPERRFFSWIYRIAVNEALTLIRKRRSSPLDSEPVGRGWSPERETQSHETVAVVQEAVGRLKPDHRVLVILRHFDGLSYKEMSDIVGVAEKTVKSRLFTARRELRALLVDTGLL
jgi:RNA polymerase sigma-70 factor (ECF subfamily)